MIRPPAVRTWIACLPVLLVGCADSASRQDRRPETARAVQLVPVARRSLPDVVQAFGALVPAERVRLAFLRGGRLASIGVDIGSPITASQVLARLDTRITALEVRQAATAVEQVRVRLELPATGEDDTVEPEQTAAVRRARALLAEARLTLARAAELAREDLGSRAALDAAEAAATVAESGLQQALTEVRNQRALLAQRRAELALAQEQLRESELLAPFTGVVAERFVDAQELVNAGQVVLAVLRTDTLRLRLDVAERDAAAVRSGQAVRFRVDGAAADVLGRVARLGPAVDTTTRTLRVEAEVDNADGRLRAGSFVRARIEVSSPTGRRLVPAGAIVSFAGVNRVFVVKDGRAHGLTVTVGRRLEKEVEIESGIDRVEQVVADPTGLVEGQPVVLAASPPRPPAAAPPARPAGRPSGGSR